MSETSRVLVIDDDVSVRQLFCFYLARCGYEVEAAESGRAGIEKMRSLRPEVILCDLRMPEVDGLEVLRTAQGEQPLVPVIVMSGAGLLEDAINAVRLGAWDYLMKPVAELALLDHAVGRALERARLLRQNEVYRRYLEKTVLELLTTLRLLEEDEDAGRLIQFQLLPERTCAIGGYDFSREIVTSAHLSGDFVDFFPIGERHIGFYLADAAGHGVASAFVTVFLKGFMRQLRDQYDTRGDSVILTPRRTLECLNREMLKERLTRHVTLCYGVIDTERNELAYSNGGQYPYPILCDGAPRLLAAKGLPLGLFPFARYDQETLSLPPRFDLALWSDGVLELMAEPGLQAKTSRLMALMEREVTAAGLREAIGVDRRPELADDVTLLLVHRGGERDPQR